METKNIVILSVIAIVAFICAALFAWVSDLMSLGLLGFFAFVLACVFFIGGIAAAWVAGYKTLQGMGVVE